MKQAIQFNEGKLEKECWDLIDLRTSKALASNAFADINEATLAELLKRESLNVKEGDLFNAVLKWSEAECLRKEIEANAKNRRSAMGNLIYQIRFASMTAQEFSQFASQSDILSPEEIILFYHNICGVRVASDVWNMTERGAKVKVILRFRRFNKYKGGGFSLVVLFGGISEHTICVSFSKPVNFHGVRLLGCKGGEYDIKLDVFSQSVEGKFRSQRAGGGIAGFDVMLPAPIQVQANVVVQLKATITGPTVETIGVEGRKKVETNGITANFFNTPGVHSNVTTVQQGQIDEIIVSEI